MGLLSVKTDLIFPVKFDVLEVSIGNMKRAIEIRVFIEKYQRYE